MYQCTGALEVVAEKLRNRNWILCVCLCLIFAYFGILSIFIEIKEIAPPPKKKTVEISCTCVAALGRNTAVYVCRYVCIYVCVCMYVYDTDVFGHTVHEL